MSVEYITKVIKYKCTPPQKLILFVLANYSDESGQSYPSHKKLCALTGLALSTVKGNLKKLKQYGYIDWKKRNNTSNLYQILGGSPDDHGGSPDDHNTKVDTKNINILCLDKINKIFKEVTSKTFYRHSTNAFSFETKWNKLNLLAKKGVISPRTGKVIDMKSEEFWYSYFEIANSEGHKKWIRSFWDKKPSLGTMLGINQFEAIIERRYG